MRSFLLFFTSLVLCSMAHAQVPSSFNYQSVVRDGFNVLIANQPIGVQASIVQDSVGGATLYSETHSVSTNTNGLFSIQIGNGAAISGSFSSIDWTTADLHYQIEIDLQGGSNYTLSSFHSFTTVPYAMVAERAIMSDDADADSTNELQQFSIVDDTIKLSKGGGYLLKSEITRTSRLLGASHISRHGMLSTGPNDTLIWIVPAGINEVLIGHSGTTGGDCFGVTQTNGYFNSTPDCRGGSGEAISFSIDVFPDDTIRIYNGLHGSDVTGAYSNNSGVVFGGPTCGDGGLSSLYLNGTLIFHSIGGKGGILPTSIHSSVCGHCHGSPGADGEIYLFGDPTNGYEASSTASSGNYGINPLGLKNLATGTNVMQRAAVSQGHTILIY